MIFMSHDFTSMTSVSASCPFQGPSKCKQTKGRLSEFSKITQLRESWSVTQVQGQVQTYTVVHHRPLVGCPFIGGNLNFIKDVSGRSSL